MKVVIIGGVAGGASAAARLRRLDEKAEILILEKGDFISFANCGLPYHVGGVIPERRALFLQSPKSMKVRYNIDVRLKNEVVSINRQEKTVTVKKLESGETYKEPYDKLIIATGSVPVRPNIPGIDSQKIKTIWSVNDTDDILGLISKENVKSAVVVGGGFIGLEMAENLTALGIKVSVVEMLDQVMPPIDYEMAVLVHNQLEAKGVDLYLSDGVTSFNDNGVIEVNLKSGTKLEAGLVILAAGVRPNSALARDAGLETGQRGAIAVDDSLRTSDNDIYAVGDVIEVTDFIFGDKTAIPLAGPANKQGRIAADNIAGLNSVYKGTQGSSVVKVFDLTVASTGANEKALIKRGIEYEKVYVVQNSHANYFPGAKQMTIKLLFSPDGKKIYGAQIVGYDGVDKRIDVVATTIRLGGSVYDLKDLELAYAPPYSSAKDPVNMAGFVAENLLSSKVRFCDWDEVDKDKDALLIDVRELSEVNSFAVPGALNITLGELRGKINELLPYKNRHIIIFCAVGVRAYNAYRILVQNGFENVSVYPGGSKFYKDTHCL
ncbi:MAG: FAD-dependent oxidoreductase [Eubacteriales bacterium]|jgi:NADPH-dependent 2,4-dienoyl-CoA reductase/sulfur reductase-like enzyme/rhodanese-related sulfurtransferase